jgi:hypothetical protein
MESSVSPMPWELRSGEVAASGTAAAPAQGDPIEYHAAELPVATAGPVFRMDLAGDRGARNAGTTAGGAAGTVHVTNYRIGFVSTVDPASTCSIPHTWIVGVYAMKVRGAESSSSGGGSGSGNSGSSRVRTLLTNKHKPGDVSYIEIECKNFRRYLFRVDLIRTDVLKKLLISLLQWTAVNGVDKVFAFDVGGSQRRKEDPAQIRTAFALSRRKLLAKALARGQVDLYGASVLLRTYNRV